MLFLIGQHSVVETEGRSLPTHLRADVNLGFSQLSNNFYTDIILLSHVQYELRTSLGSF